MSAECAALNVHSTDLPVPAASAAADDTRLFELQLAFNLFPAMYVHSSWFERPGWSWCGEGDQQRSSFWIRQSSAQLLREWRLDQQFDWDFSDRGKRLALIDAPTLPRLSELVSAVLMRDRLRRLVRHDEVRAVQDAIGVQTHLYAVRWRGPLPLLADTFACQGINDGGVVSATEHRQQCVRLSAACIPEGACGARGRLQFKFPRHWQENCEYAERLTEMQRSALVELFVAIIADVSPQWFWLFASRAGAARAPEKISQAAPC